MKKKVLTVILCVLAAVAVFAGITAVEHFRYCPRESLGFGTYTNPKLEQLNESLDYTVYSYTYDHPFRDGRSAVFSNLTQTDSTDSLADILTGWRIYTSVEDYTAISDRLAAMAAENGDGIDPIRQHAQTAEHTYDEAFFAEYNLLVVDLCSYSGVTLFTYPDAAAPRGNHVRLKLRYNLAATAFDQFIGYALFFPVPKDCTSADVTFLRNDGHGCWICAIQHFFDWLDWKDELPPVN